MMSEKAQEKPMEVKKKKFWLCYIELYCLEFSSSEFRNSFETFKYKVLFYSSYFRDPNPQVKKYLFTIAISRKKKKKRVKLLLYADDMILYIEKPKEGFHTKTT